MVVQTLAPAVPRELRTSTLRTFVRARFDIAADGGFQVTLLTSSGNPQLDALTLETLRRWRWQPAIVNGQPTASIQRVRVEFVVD